VNQPSTAHYIAAMRQAIVLAKRGMTTTTPNPRVGCVLIDDSGRVIGAGFHRRAGGPHAEVEALRQAGPRARGATAVVTLEPCAHHGRTPPCADALIAAGVHRVVYGMTDPNPLVSGKGLTRLAEAGIEVIGPLLEESCRALNPGFIRRMKEGRPAFFLKTAASLDGRIALSNGASRWITGLEARCDVHRWRARCCALMTGIATVLADDPALTVRHVATDRPPVRIVLDSRLQLPETATLVTDRAAPTWVITTAAADPAKADRLTQQGVTVHCLPADRNGRVDLVALASFLGQAAINEVLVEAGPTLAYALLAQKWIDRWIHYLAPKALGGDARPLLPPLALTELAAAPHWQIDTVRRFGEDLRIEFVPTPTTSDRPTKEPP